MDLRRVRDMLVGIWLKRELIKFHKRGGKIIMITGSYAKTSVKELTYDLLRHKYRTLSTSRNYNTMMGIAKTVKYELTNNIDWLILEVGAYRVGEITEFCKVIQPDIGVVTGIARQHLERFGSWEKIIEAKTEIVRYIRKTNGILIANGSDETVKANVSADRWYSGKGREEINKNGAKEIARAVGMSEHSIAESTKYFRQVPSRFEMTKDRYGMAVIDDSYNSNEISFVEAVEYLGEQDKYTRILVTPGLVELGNENQKIHTELGKKIIGNADLVILIGKNERTENLAKGIGTKIKIIWIDKTLSFMKVVKDLKLKKEPVVLIENDVPENY